MRQMGRITFATSENGSKYDKEARKKDLGSIYLAKNIWGQNTEKIVFWEIFFSKNRFFGQISQSIVLKPYYNDRTSSSDQFPCLVTKFEFSGQKLQTSQKFFKLV